MFYMYAKARLSPSKAQYASKQENLKMYAWNQNISIILHPKDIKQRKKDDMPLVSAAHWSVVRLNK